MGIFTRNKKKEVRMTETEIYDALVLGTLSWSSVEGYEQTKALKLSAVYRAVNLISDSVAILPLDNYTYEKDWKKKQRNNLDYLLNVQPNKLMSAYTFKKQIVQYILLKGNAYIHITRKGDTPTEFILLDPDFIKVMLVKGEKKYIYNNDVTYEDSDIIHIMNFSTNGLIGSSTLKHAATTLETAYFSEGHANNFFKGNGNMAGILSPKQGVNITEPKAKAAKEAFTNASNASVTGGISNSVVVLDSGLEYNPISVNPKQAQLLESRAFNFITIAQFFGVSPHKLFDFSKGGYNSNEMSQIDFLNTTLQPLLEKIENEIYRKIYTKVENNITELRFDVSNLFRLDATAQADYYTKMFFIGAITSNEIREKIDSSYPVKGGNRAFVAVGVQPLDNLISEQTDTSDTSKQIDNKLK